MVDKAVSILEFFQRFPNEQACIDYIFESRYGQGGICPACGKPGNWTRIRGTKKYAHHCRKHISVLKGTPFYRSNFSLVTVFFALLLFANSPCGVRTSFLRKHLGLGTRAAHRLGNLIRLHMASLQPLKRFSSPSAPVEVDEVYLRYFKVRGAEGLKPKILMGMFHNGEVQCGFISNRKGPVLTGAIRRFVSRETLITTDQFKGYQGLSALGYRHETVNHSKGEFYRGMVSTVNIDSCWSVFRRNFRLYHQVGLENAWLYLAEAQFRYNLRGDPREAFFKLISTWPGMLAKSDLRARFEWG